MSKTILLIDDDTDDTELFKEALFEIDQSVILNRTGDGQEAIDTLDTLKIPDMIFLDINMPGMNGWQFLSEIKANLKYRDIPVIMYTTSSEPEEVKKSLALGALCFIPKPSNYEDLKRVINFFVKNTNKDWNEALTNFSKSVRAKFIFH